MAQDLTFLLREPALACGETFKERLAVKLPVIRPRGLVVDIQKGLVSALDQEIVTGMQEVPGDLVFAVARSETAALDISPRTGWRPRTMAMVTLTNTITRGQPEPPVQPTPPGLHPPPAAGMSR